MSVIIPVLNKKAVLQRLDGDEELYAEIVQVFLEDTPKQLDALQESLESGDKTASERYAHSLKSACANIGAERMSKLAANLENKARQDQLDSVRQGLASLIEELEQLKAELSLI